MSNKREKSNEKRNKKVMIIAIFFIATFAIFITAWFTLECGRHKKVAVLKHHIMFDYEIGDKQDDSSEQTTPDEAESESTTTDLNETETRPDTLSNNATGNANTNCENETKAKPISQDNSNNVTHNNEDVDNTGEADNNKEDEEEPKKIPVTIKIDNKSSVYGSPQKELTYTITKGDVTQKDLNITLTKEAGKEVGTYKITGKCSGKEYDVTFINGTYTITKNKMKVKIDSKTSYEGEPLKKLTYQIVEGHLVNGDKADKVFKLETNADSTKAGRYKITGKTINKNYHINYKYGKYVVEEKNSDEKIPVTIKIDDKSSVYGSPQKELTYTITSGNVKKKDLKGCITLTKESGTAVDTYAITGKCSSKKYDVTFINGIYTITKNKMKVKIDSKTSYEGEALKELTYQIVEGGLVNGDTAGKVFNLETDADSTKAGRYKITGKTINNNYHIDYEYGEYVVEEKNSDEKIPVTIKIDDKSSVYGSQQKELTYTITKGDVTQKDLNITLTKEAGKEVGTYKITGKCSSKEYDVTFINGTYTITENEMKVKIDSKTSYEGEALKELTYQIVEGGLVNGDTAEEVFELQTDADITKAGKYKITGKTINKNYHIDYEYGEYVVEEKNSYEKIPVTIKIDDKSSVYGSQQKELTYTITSGNVKKKDLEGCITLTKESGTAVDTYAITGKCSSDKYDVSFINGTYTITENKMKVKIDSKTSYEGEALKELTYQIVEGGLVNGDKAEEVFELQTDADITKAGRYKITGKTINNNYHVDYEYGEYVVEVKLKEYDTSGWNFDKTTFDYDGFGHRPELTGVPSEVIVKYSLEPQTKADKYTLTVTFTVPKDYKPVEDMTTEFEINKAIYDDIPLTFNDEEIVKDSDGNAVVSTLFDDNSVDGYSIKLPEDITLPDGVTFSHYEVNGAKVDDDYSITSPGTYSIEAVFNQEDLENYEKLVVKATLKLEHAFEVTLSAEQSGEQLVVTVGIANIHKEGFGMMDWMFRFELPEGVTYSDENQIGDSGVEVIYNPDNGMALASAPYNMDLDDFDYALEDIPQFYQFIFDIDEGVDEVDIKMKDVTGSYLFDYDNIIQAMGPDKQTGPISIVRELKLRDEITTEPLIVETIEMVDTTMDMVILEGARETGSEERKLEEIEVELPRIKEDIEDEIFETSDQ